MIARDNVMRFKVSLVLVLAGVSLSVFASPAWVNDPYYGLDRNTFLAAVGVGNTLDKAEASAKSEIASVFGMSVQTQTVQDSGLSVTNNNGVKSDNYYSNFTSNKVLSNDLSNLVGVTIREHYQDHGTWYVHATLNKDEMADYYAQLAGVQEAYLRNRCSYVANHLGEWTAYSEAKQLLEVYDDYQETLKVIYVLDPRIARNTIPDVEKLISNCRSALTVSVDADNATLRKAIDGYLASQSLSNSSNSRYVITASLDCSSYPAPRGNVYVDYVLDLAMLDRQTKNLVFSKSTTGREGHRSEAQAKARIMNKLPDIVQEILNEELDL